MQVYFEIINALNIISMMLSALGAKSYVLKMLSTIYSVYSTLSIFVSIYSKWYTNKNQKTEEWSFEQASVNLNGCAHWLFQWFT